MREPMIGEQGNSSAGWLRKICKFAFAWGIAAAIIYTFDCIIMVWLAKKFGYFMVLPLYPAIFLVCWAGLYIYDFLDEDVFFINKINDWLKKEGRYRITKWIKEIINKNSGNTFMAISIWESPLHGYLYFRKEGDSLFFFLKRIAVGSIYCAIFWGIVVSALVAIWEVTKPYMSLSWDWLSSFY